MSLANLDLWTTTVWLPAAAMLLMLIVVATVWWRRNGVAATREAVCGKCGYAVAGAATFICPECGSDLRQVGIDRARPPVDRVSNGMVRLGVGLALWTLAYGALYAVVAARSFPGHPWDLTNRRFHYGFVDAYWWPYEGDSVHSVTLTPASGAYRQVTVTEERHARFNGWRHAPMIDWTGDSPAVGLTRFAIRLQVDTLNGKSTTLSVDPATLGYQFADAQGQPRSGTPIDGPAVWGWLMASGVDMPSIVVQ